MVKRPRTNNRQTSDEVCSKQDCHVLIICTAVIISNQPWWTNSISCISPYFQVMECCFTSSLVLWDAYLMFHYQSILKTSTPPHCLSQQSSSHIILNRSHLALMASLWWTKRAWQAPFRITLWSFASYLGVQSSKLSDITVFPKIFDELLSINTIHIILNSVLSDFVNQIINTRTTALYLTRTWSSCLEHAAPQTYLMFCT